MSAYTVTIQDKETGELTLYDVNDFVFAGSDENNEIFTAQTDNIAERSLLVAKVNKELQEDID